MVEDNGEGALIPLCAVLWYEGVEGISGWGLAYGGGVNWRALDFRVIFEDPGEINIMRLD